MSTLSKARGVLPPEVLLDLQKAARRAKSGIRDPEEMRRACQRMDHMAEENRKQLGVQNIGVEIIRELRGPLSE